MYGTPVPQEGGVVVKEGWLLVSISSCESFSDTHRHDINITRVGRNPDVTSCVVLLRLAGGLLGTGHFDDVWF